jgi:uncharacterized alkaline shock family protein YloU
MEVSDPVPATSPLDEISLPCGADVDALLEQAALGRGGDWDVHQGRCVHCQAALGEFSGLWEPVAQLAAAPVPAPPRLVSAVVSQVRRLMQDAWYTLEVTDIGAVRIAARIVAALACQSARTVPGVRMALGRSARAEAPALAEKATFGHRHPAAVGVLGHTAVVDLAIAIGYDRPAPEIAREIQRHVTATLRDQAGLRNIRVDVTIDDVLDGVDGEGAQADRQGGGPR